MYFWRWSNLVCVKVYYYKRKEYYLILYYLGFFLLFFMNVNFGRWSLPKAYYNRYKSGTPNNCLELSLCFRTCSKRLWPYGFNYWAETVLTGRNVPLGFGSPATLRVTVMSSPTATFSRSSGLETMMAGFTPFRSA